MQLSLLYEGELPPELQKIRDMNRADLFMSEDPEYQKFLKLLNTEFDLRREVHWVSPSEKKTLERSIDAVHKQLKSMPRYKEFLKFWARTADSYS